MSIITAVFASQSHDANRHQNAEDAAPEDAQHSTAGLLAGADFEAPYGGEELAVYDDAQDGAMGGKQKVVEADRGLGRLGMPECVLRAYRRRVEEGVVGARVGDEAQYIQRREVDGEA
jgi:hypothetical protein